LAVLLGRYPTAMELTPFDPERQARGIGAYGLPLGVPSELLARRPDVIIAEQSLAAATASEGVAMANRFPFPTIGFSALFGRTSTDLGSLFDSGASAAINSWGPLIGYRRAVQGALFDVNAASYAYRSADEQLAPLTEQYTAAARTLTLQELRFKAGVVNYLSVLDAQRLVLSSDLSLARARLARDLAFVDLYQALGGGWDPDAPLPEPSE
jgi:outer membrane protein, multidrug efflux system